MKLKSWLKGKKKQIEIRKLSPDNEFEFEKNYYGVSENINGFKFIYCNNYTDKLYVSNKNILSFLSCIISLPNTTKILQDLINFINTYTYLDIHNNLQYRSTYIVMGTDKIDMYLRGNLHFYSEICNNIHNNIITRYIRNNIFPNELSIETPNEFLNNIYNSITNPNKEIDILFIEDNLLCKSFSPVIGLSISKNCDKINIDNYLYSIVNNRYIIYCELKDLIKEDLNYIVNNVKHGNKLLELVHINIEDDDIDSEIDEIIEE